MVRQLVETCYLDVTRYGTSGFLRIQLMSGLGGASSSQSDMPGELSVAGFLGTAVKRAS